MLGLANMSGTEDLGPHVNWPLAPKVLSFFTLNLGRLALVSCHVDWN